MYSCIQHKYDQYNDGEIPTNTSTYISYMYTLATVG